jgi:hypothetical protein
MLIPVQNDPLTPYSTAVQIGSGWLVNYKPKYGNILPASIMGNIYVGGVLSQSFTSNDGGQFTVSFVSQLSNWIKFGTFNFTTGFFSFVWADQPSPPDTFTIIASYSFNTATENPIFFPTHEDGN